MNKDQRNELSGVLDIVTRIRDEEQEKLDNMPENLQDSERAERFQEGIDKLEEITDLLEELLEGGF